MRSILAAFALFALLSTTPAMAIGCPEHFAGGVEPALVDPRLAARARELCYRGYAVLHSGVARTPLWAAEHPARLARLSVLRRNGSFIVRVLSV